MTAAELAEQLELMTYGVGAQTPDGTFPLPDKMPTFAPAALLRQAAARLRSMEERLVKMEWHMSRIAIRTEFFDPGSPPDVIHQEARAALSGEGQ